MVEPSRSQPAFGEREMGKPRASFIMAVNRDNPWLEQAIQSVLSQDEPRFEFLIGANACDDSLWHKLVGYAVQDPRIRLSRSSIGQLSFNLNLLADQATTPYLVRMDADDVCLPNRLSTLLFAMERYGLDVLGSAVAIIDGDSREIGNMAFPRTAKAISRALTRRTVFCHPAVMLRKQFLLDMRGYLGGFVSEDTDLWLRAERQGARMGNLPDILLHYRLHQNQSIMSSLGYAEVASHWLRECLLRPSFRNVGGLLVSLGKCLMARWAPGIRRYLKPRSRRTS